jgi:PAS domain S-box-containing protein
VQTSLTPILDDFGNISKLITIGTDINRIKAADEKLLEQNQKIIEQSKLLEQKNKELEKLSLVAKETDSAISILDAAGNIQWINDGYSKLYGYSYEQLLEEYSGHIITMDLDNKIKSLIKKCIEQHVPVSYENQITVHSGKQIWVQTTLTPLKNIEGAIKSIISISQDISMLKNAEQAIRRQSEELIAQKDELLLQKDKIEQHNNNIRNSLNYANTIQSAMLPLKASLDKGFESFIIYKPKDIVSGDFYWHSFQPGKNGGNGKHFIAAVDCTGHGVPGAFMSMIGFRLLNEIVKEKGVDKPPCFGEDE